MHDYIINYFTYIAVVAAGDGVKIALQVHVWQLRCCTGGYRHMHYTYVFVALFSPYSCFIKIYRSLLIHHSIGARSQDFVVLNSAFLCGS